MNKIICFFVIFTVLLSFQTIYAHDNFTQNIQTFDDIQNKIDSSKNIDTILLQGDYYGSSEITINKVLTIKGDNAQLNAQSKSRILNIEADNVIIENIIFIKGKQIMVLESIQMPVT